MKKINYIKICFLFSFLLLGNIFICYNKIQAAVKEEKTVLVGNTIQLEKDEKIKWKSKNCEIATVTQKGIVKGVQAGKTKIIAKSKDKTTIYFLTVKKKKLNPREIYKIASKSTVEIVTYDKDGWGLALGTGFFIEKGVLVTNYHVIMDAMYIDIFDYQGKAYETKGIYAYDKEKDLVVLQVEANNEALPIGKKKVKTGDSIYTLGSSEGLTGTFSSGIVSNASRKEGEFYYIQITAPLSSGNSGGPLLNAYGEVVGINTMQYIEGQNLNFAIPIREIEELEYFSAPKPIVKVTNGDKEKEEKKVYEAASQSQSIKTAQLLLEDEIMVGKIESGSSLDYYHVRIKKESLFMVGVGTTTLYDYFGLNLAILDKEGNAIDFFEKAQYQESTIYSVYLSKGDYYICVSPKPLLETKETEYQLQIIIQDLE